MVERSLFRVWLSYTFNNLQVTDGCVSPSKHVQVILIMGCIVGCGDPCSDALRVNPRIDLTDFHDLQFLPAGGGSASTIFGCLIDYSPRLRSRLHRACVDRHV